MKISISQIYYTYFNEGQVQCTVPFLSQPGVEVANKDAPEYIKEIIKQAKLQRLLVLKETYEGYIGDESHNQDVVAHSLNSIYDDLDALNGPNGITKRMKTLGEIRLGDEIFQKYGITAWL